MRDDASTLVDRILSLGSGSFVVVTGAGVSAASGLPTFRGSDPGAIWARDVTEIGTREAFERDPVGWWIWFLDRFSGILGAQPNPAHRALADLERWHTSRGGGFLLVTQNVDTLHEQAGSRNLVKVHGSADRVRCTRPGCRFAAPTGSLPRPEVDLERLVREPREANLPRCAACGALLRAHALLFDELYTEHLDYGFARVEEAFGRMDTLLFVGTSFSVGVTELALRAAWQRRIVALSVDPAGTAPPGVLPLATAAETLLPAVVSALEGVPATR